MLDAVNLLKRQLTTRLDQSYILFRHCELRYPHESLAIARDPVKRALPFSDVLQTQKSKRLFATPRQSKSTCYREVFKIILVREQQGVPAGYALFCGISPQKKCNGWHPLPKNVSNFRGDTSDCEHETRGNPETRFFILDDLSLTLSASP